MFDKAVLVNKTPLNQPPISGLGGQQFLNFLILALFYTLKNMKILTEAIRRDQQVPSYLPSLAVPMPICSVFSLVTTEELFLFVI